MQAKAQHCKQDKFVRFKLRLIIPKLPNYLKTPHNDILASLGCFNAQMSGQCQLKTKRANVGFADISMYSSP